MKRKFFTLLAVAAFCGFGVANAQIAPGDVHTSALKQGNLYHVGGASDNYLYVYGPNGEDLKWGKTDTLSRGLWCVNAQTPVNSTYPEFTFENKGEGLVLGVDLSPYFAKGDTVFEAKLGTTDVATWRFSSKYQNGMDTEENYLMSYPPVGATYLKDSVAVLTWKNDSVFVELIPAPSASATTDPAVTSGYTLIKANLYDAAPIVLTADMFNTLFGSTDSAARKLNYIDPKIDELETSPLKDAFLAKESGVANYLTLRLGSDTTQVLRVDTTVYNTAGDPYLKYAYSTYAQYTKTSNPIVKQHHFRMVYLPSVDSLIVNVEEVRLPVKGDDLKKPSTWTNWATPEQSNNDEDYIAANHKLNPTPASDKTYLVVQNLTNTTYCLTVGQFPVQIHIGLGFTGCTVVDDDRTTLQGLYFIKNTKEEYLQVPIYTDSLGGAHKNSAPQWVKIENFVDINEIPSFQWAVVKVRNNSDVSMVNIINREYDVEVPMATIQLYKKANVSPKLFGADVNLAGFVEVGEKYRTDKYLGYKNVPEDIAKLRTYTFEYLHFSGIEDFFLSVKNSQTDSTLYVQKDASDAFELAPYHHSLSAKNEWSYAPVGYGYNVATLNERLGKGYATNLVRTAYVLKIKEGSKLFNTNKIVVADKDKRAYAVASVQKGIAAGDSAVFYLKTNNTKEGRNYYALVDTSSFTVTGNPMFTSKVGVADNEAWAKVENHYEIRTSAFAVELNEEPLYRRFNRLTDGAIGADSFYEEKEGVDDPDTLRFFRVNNVKEFLYEDAHSVYSINKGINFLGVKHTADFGLEDAALAERTAMYVDTAFVNRPAVPTSGFDTPKPQYLLGVGVYKVEGTTTEIPCEPSVTTPFYVRGRYLINATDSVYGVGANWASQWAVDANGKTISPVKNSNYIWDTKWERLAFVDAVHLYDTLYVLNGAKYEDPIDFNALRKDARVHAIRLDNNYHKDVVFSFRLIDTEKGVNYADQIQNFLIESETTDRNIVTGEMIAPMTGGWVKIQNGVPVISRGFFEDAITDAEKFNVVKTDANPVSNEVLNGTDVKVVADAGAVTILNAAGKTVTISNILGQTVANQVISSDNVTIAAPKGIVVVAIQGEEPVKAIVK